MVCKKCGKVLNDEDKFCSGCGTKVTIQENEEKLETSVPKKDLKGSIPFKWDLEDYEEKKVTKDDKVTFDWDTLVKKGKEREETQKKEINSEQEDDRKMKDEIDLSNGFDITFSDQPQGSGIKVDDFLAELEIGGDAANKDELELEYGKVHEQINPSNMTHTQEIKFDEMIRQEAEFKSESKGEIISDDVILLDKTDEEKDFVPQFEKDKLEKRQSDEASDEINIDYPIRSETSSEPQENIDLTATRRIDKFYTFNEKNQEFQKLLDEEYDKIKGDASVDELKNKIIDSNKVASETAKKKLSVKKFGASKTKTDEKSKKEKAQKNTQKWVEILQEDDMNEKLSKEERKRLKAEAKANKKQRKKDDEASDEPKKNEELERKTEIAPEKKPNENKNTIKESAKELENFDDINHKGKGNLAYKITVIVLSVMAVLLAAILAVRIFIPDSALSKQIENWVGVQNIEQECVSDMYYIDFV